jgi:hypothetical protein
MQHVFRVVEIHLDLFQHHLLLFGHIFRIKPWAQYQVRDHVKCDRQILVQHFGVETNLFLGCESIEHAANRIHFARDGFGGAALRALEHHVFHEVGQPVLLGGLPPRTVAYPHPD